MCMCRTKQSGTGSGDNKNVHAFRGACVAPEQFRSFGVNPNVIVAVAHTAFIAERCSISLAL